MMESKLSVYIILIGYFMLTIGLGLFATKRPGSSTEDFYLSGRNLNVFKVFFTLIATNFSAFFFLGFAGESYRMGYSYYHMMAFGTSIAAITFFVIGAKSWKLGKKFRYVTPIEIIREQSKSRFLAVIFLLVMVLFMIPFLAVQPIGAGLILERLTDGAISYNVGATILTIFIVAYVFVNGMNGLVTMDIKNGILMITLIILAAFVIAWKLGGVEVINNRLFNANEELFSIDGIDKKMNLKVWISYIVLWFCAIPMFPHVFMRFLMSKNMKTFRLTSFLYTLIPPFLFIIPVFIGVMGYLSFPDLVGKEADSILPMMLVEHTPIWLGALVLVGALAAFMSTMDSILLALGTMLTRDWYKVHINSNLTEKKEINYARLFIIILSVISLLIAWIRPASIFTLATMAFSALAILFPVFCLVLYGKNYHPKVVGISIIIGLMVLSLFQLEIIPKEWSIGFLPVIPAVLICTIVMVLFGLKYPQKKV